MSPLRWTVKSTRNLAAKLTRQGHRVSADTVGDLLREEGFSLQADAKTVEGKQHPDRDAQFQYINERAREHMGAGQPVITAQLVHMLANDVMALNRQVAELDKAIEARSRDHHTFDVITSMPGLGIILGAEFLAATGGDMSAFGTADRLAGFGGVAPVPRDSGKISGNLRRPQRYNRRLQRVFYTSALFSIRHCEESRRFYDRKRAEGKRHTQAVLALARRRVNVLWPSCATGGATSSPRPLLTRLDRPH